MRSCTPPPHVALHVSQLPQSLSSQSTLQRCVLHARVCDVGPHGLPPFSGLLMMLRTRDWEPPPHVAVHVFVPQASQTCWTQLTGHPASLQVRDSLITPQPAPPLDAGVWMVRWRVCQPPPHVASHALKGSHEETQSTAQDCGLHDSVSEVCAHGKPARSACKFADGAVVIGRLRVRVPAPQLLEHVPQACQSPRTQSCGHGCALHTSLDVDDGHDTAAHVSLPQGNLRQPLSSSE